MQWGLYSGVAACWSYLKVTNLSSNTCQISQLPQLITIQYSPPSEKKKKKNRHKFELDGWGSETARMVISHQNLHTMKFCLLLSKKIITLRPILVSMIKKTINGANSEVLFFYATDSSKWRKCGCSGKNSWLFHIMKCCSSLLDPINFYI